MSIMMKVREIQKRLRKAADVLSGLDQHRACRVEERVQRMNTAYWMGQAVNRQLEASQARAELHELEMALLTRFVGSPSFSTVRTVIENERRRCQRGVFSPAVLEHLRIERVRMGAS